MNPISSLSYSSLGFLAAWQMLLLLCSVLIVVVGGNEKRRIDPALQKTLLLLMTAFIYLMFQFTADMISGKAIHPPVILMEKYYGKMSVLCIVVICFLLTAAEIYSIIAFRRWNRTHITSGSIKEAIETLPVGICAYEASGKVTLKNTTMEQLCRRLTTEALLNGNALSQAVEEGKGGLVEHTVEFPDFGVWSFKREDIGDIQNAFTLLVAYNVTEIYQKTQTLNDKRKAVEQLNERLTEYNRRIESVAAEKEILAAKIRIHDEIGTNLLAIKRYLINGADSGAKTEILDRAGRDIAFLLEKDAASSDEYELMLTTARALGVTVEIEGSLPQTQPHKHIIAAAIHECLTNTLRHAHGDLLHIRVRGDGDRIVSEFTNNGTQPGEEIEEKGGLASLRTLIESSRGCMIIRSVPQFTLTLTLPKEDPGDVI